MENDGQRPIYTGVISGLIKHVIAMTLNYKQRSNYMTFNIMTYNMSN